MKKLTRKQVDDRELQFLTETGLTAEELQVVRKLNGATMVPGYQGNKPSTRTIEAVLQGRRSNPRLLQAAIKNAKDTLDRYVDVLNKLLEKMRSVKQ
jgi:hypothetical protein